MSTKTARRNDKEYQRAYYLRNIDKLKKQKKNHYTKIKKQYCKERTEYYYANKPVILKQMRIRHLRESYGISLADYDAMKESQQNCCAICGIESSKLPKILCVDHDHKTGKVRGLLCDSCNRGLGYFKDNPNITQGATQYLTKHQ